ncbi:CRISPR system precrRNA processing endoribonuclease RAMP protein Cas6 [Halomonas sp. GFAJ-1]|uniref:CRISPR system precrRNA processing endoribonuclease RAMP protein Cas6 n=1 Tax=Halomonas sp. GFAJ-1 TaxID=1118153 RepID=UPI00023A33C8|nr:CRISPR system precrRNA processing endoribonuclease RAMP protein Cas6 [Halomonas sp. GFAJ-1]AVI62977.1 hypothetical protein BB497_09875 [Halomonas sp. GFAJ-1]EHK60284.1 hypothetical protein MOY_11312 [Halomonas sp. GFAJ-1]
MPIAFPDAMPIARYRLTLRAEAPFRLTGYPGAMLRGAWGHALRRLACSTGRDDCQGCPVRPSCRYVQLFEPVPDKVREVARDIPPPYIVQAALSQPKALSVGDSWAFEMVLFGKALAELPLIVWAWQLAARAGLGDQQSPMRLVSVDYQVATHHWETVWEAGETALVPTQAPRIRAHHAVLNLGSALEPVPTSVKLALITPMRLQHKGRICEPHQLTADVFFNSLWRKLALYLGHYASMTLPTMPSKQGLRLQPLSLERQRWARHSRRQQHAMRLDGVTGTLSIHGALQEWWPWLLLGQYTHLGKNTSFGLGQYHLVLEAA